jgi:ketosteroid isomerase-like protein
MIPNRMWAACWLGLLLTGGAAEHAWASDDCDFDCTLKRHLDAIQARDFDAFEATLTRGPRLSFILPNGKYFDDATAYRDMLKGWFAEDGWTFNYQTVAVEQTADMGHALLLVSYDEADREGKPYHLDHYLSLLFKREGDGWFLVHDQNTGTVIESGDSTPTEETPTTTEQTP